MDDPVSVPLGFWLRTVDSLFDTSMDEMFTAAGVTRRLWQVLNTIKRNEPVSTQDVDAAMAMFLDEDVPSSSPLLEDVGHRGWVDVTGGSWTLTDDGRSAVADLEQQVTRHREVMFRGVDDTDYRTTVETLARVANNLDPHGTRSTQFR